MRILENPIFRKESPKSIKGVNKLVQYTVPIEAIKKERNKTAHNSSLDNNMSMNKPQATNLLQTLSTTPVQIVSILDTFIHKDNKMNITNDNQCSDSDKRHIQKRYYLEDDAKKPDGHHKISHNNVTSFNNFKRYKNYYNNQVSKAKKPERVDFRFQNCKYKKTLKKIYGTVKMNSSQNQKLYCNGVPKIASTPCILEKDLAKENVLDDRLSSSSAINLLKNYNWSLYSLHLLSYKTPLNNSSSTLVPRNFSTSIIDDINSMPVKNCRLQECKTDTYNNLVAAYDSLKQNTNENAADQRTMSSPSAEPTLQQPEKRSVGVGSNYDDNILIAQKLAKNKASNNFHFAPSSSETTMSSVLRDNSDKNDVSHGSTLLKAVIMLDNIICTSNAGANTVSNAGETKERLPECLKDNLNNDTPTDVNKMWARFTLVLGSALKRLQNTFKMEMRDIKKNVESHLQHNDYLNEIKTEEIEVLQENVELNPKSNAVLGLQNNFTETKVQLADQIMLIMNMDEPVKLPNSSFKTHRIGKDVIGISRPHTVEDVEEGKGDTVASVVLVATDEPHRFERLKFWVRTLLLLARENAVAIAVSIPCFFIIFSWLSEMFVLIKSIEHGIKPIQGSTRVD